MSKRKFVNHIASRKAVPIAMELKESVIELAPDYATAQLVFKKAKAIGPCSLQEATVVSCDVEGDRQWIRLNFDNEFADADFQTWLTNLQLQLVEALGKGPMSTTSNLLLSRFRKDYQGKPKVPLRLWKMDRSGKLQPYEGCLSVGMVIICSFDEMRAYEKDSVNVACELQRDIVVVKKSNKKRRKIVYFSDSD